MKKPSDCYVYTYCDPITGNPFYVGQGSGVDDNARNHIIHVKNKTKAYYQDRNLSKIRTIQRILSTGKEPRIHFVFRGSRQECEVIKSFLINRTPGLANIHAQRAINSPGWDNGFLSFGQ